MDTDKTTVHLVIMLIGALAVGLGAAAVWLTATGSTVPDQLWTIETALVAALITLATTRSRPNDAPAVYQQTLEQLTDPAPTTPPDVSHADVAGFEKA